MNKIFPIQLDEDLHKRVKIAAIREGVTLHDWIIKTLEDKLKSNGHNGKNTQKRETNDQRNRPR